MLHNIQKSWPFIRRPQWECRTFALDLKIQREPAFCRLPEPTLAQSRWVHVQTPEAAK